MVAHEYKNVQQEPKLVKEASANRTQRLNSHCFNNIVEAEHGIYCSLHPSALPQLSAGPLNCSSIRSSTARYKRSVDGTK